MLISDRFPQNPRDILSFSGVWAFYLPRELQRCGVEIVRSPLLRPNKIGPAEIIEHYRSLPLDGVNHVLALGLRYFSTLPPEAGITLRSRLGDGCLAQLHDGSLLDGTPADCTFTVRDDGHYHPLGSPNDRHERHQRFAHHLGWAADPELCRPMQDERTLTILVDHPTFVANSADLTLHVLLNVRELVRSGKWRSRFTDVRIRQFVDSDIIDIDPENFSVRPYNRQGVPYPRACEEYSRAHIFLPTHRESVGLSVIEAATAGALVVSPTGYIPKDRISTVRHIEYENAIPWDAVLKSIDVNASREMAIRNSWPAIAEKVIAYFLGFDRKAHGWPKGSGVHDDGLDRPVSEFHL